MAKYYSGYAPHPDATPAEQKKFYTRFIYIALVAFPLLTWIIVSDLNGLESGEEERVSVWAPVAFIYNHLGYWAAVLSVPAVFIFVLVAFAWKIKKIKPIETTTVL